MKEICMCMERRRAPGRVSAPLCSAWISDTPASRQELYEMVSTGSRDWGEGTHWIEVRSRPFGGVVRSVKALLWAQEPRP